MYGENVRTEVFACESFAEESLQYIIVLRHL